MAHLLLQNRVAYDYACSFYAYDYYAYSFFAYSFFAYSYACHPSGLEQAVQGLVLRSEYQIQPTQMDRCILCLRMKAELQRLLLVTS